EVTLERRELCTATGIRCEAFALGGFESRLQARFANHAMGRYRGLIGLEHERVARNGIEERSYAALTLRAQQHVVARGYRCEARSHLGGETGYAIAPLAIVQAT